ncbi:hypothetical protein [Pseudomonas fulva]|uniref:hypothetical protein n=1 Tax=Pseudomonas fulva TaxID=47880 RepID=UPI00384A5208
MKVSWKSKNPKLKPQVILNRLKQCSMLNEAGELSWNGFEKFELDSVLFTMLDFEKNVSYHTAKRTMSSALNSWALAKGESAEQFMAHLQREVVSYKKLPLQEFVLVTSVSLDGGFPYQRIELGSCVIESCPNGLPDEFSSREVHNDRWKKTSPPMPANYCPILVKFSAKNYMDGVEKALYELDFVRGIFSLDTNSGLEWSLGGHINRSPLNKITLGGMHSLHNVDGSIYDKNIYWYEADFEERKVHVISPERLTRARDFYDFVTASLETHGDRHIIKDSIVRYVRAYDLSDRNSTVQRAWATIESILAPDENNADKIVSRCSFLYADREYYRQILEHVKEYRNRNVHQAHSIDDPSPHCYQLQMFYRQSLIFHLREAKNFESLGEANKFLDSSDSIPELKRRKELLEKAIQFLDAEPGYC